MSVRLILAWETHETAEFIVAEMFEVLDHNLSRKASVNHEQIRREKIEVPDEWKLVFIFSKNRIR